MDGIFDEREASTTHSTEPEEVASDFLKGYAKWRTTGRYPGHLRRDALHEAAHAIVADVLGLYVEFTTLSCRTDSEYLHAVTRVLPSGMGALAGPRTYRRCVVESLAGYAADGRDWRRVQDAEGDRGDRDAARAMASHLVETTAEREALLAHLYVAARRLVRRHRVAIDRLAAELLDEETVSGDRVRALRAETERL